MERGELVTLVQWIDRLPKELVIDYPWLKIAQAWALAQSGSFEKANAWLPSDDSLASRVIPVYRKKVPVIFLAILLQSGVISKSFPWVIIRKPLVLLNKLC